MKITATLLMLLALLLPNVFAQEEMRLSLPEGAVACLGKGSVEEILYSPDGSRLLLSVLSVFGSMTQQPIEGLLCSLGGQVGVQIYRSARLGDACQLGYGQDRAVVGH